MTPTKQQIEAAAENRFPEYPDDGETAHHDTNFEQRQDGFIAGAEWALQHLEAAAWVTDGSLPPKIRDSCISVNCIIDCGFARNYVGYYHFDLKQWRHSNDLAEIEGNILQYYPIPPTPPTPPTQ